MILMYVWVLTSKFRDASGKKDEVRPVAVVEEDQEHVADQWANASMDNDAIRLEVGNFTFAGKEFRPEPAPEVTPAEITNRQLQTNNQTLLDANAKLLNIIEQLAVRYKDKAILGVIKGLKAEGKMAGERFASELLRKRGNPMDSNKYPGDIAYQYQNKWGGGFSNLPATWIVTETGVILHAYEDAHNMQQLEEQVRQHAASDGETLKEGSIRISCWKSVPDEARRAIIDAGWPLPHPTQQTHQEADDAFNERVKEDLHQKKELRSGGQKLDATVPSDTPPVPTESERWIEVKGSQETPFRIKSQGFGAAWDSLGMGDVEYALRKNGAEIHYIGLALTQGFVGSVTGGGIQEICYDLAGKRWYMYVLLERDIDDWQQEWWVSPQRLTAHAAGDVIVACRDMKTRDEIRRKEINEAWNVPPHKAGLRRRNDYIDAESNTED
jgi:hypothetical protein